MIEPADTGEASAAPTENIKLEEITSPVEDPDIKKSVPTGPSPSQQRTHLILLLTGIILGVLGLVLGVFLSIRFGVIVSDARGYMGAVAADVGTCSDIGVDIL
eukprot:EC725054.1.p1 GENE.EC725054.1~~EC725054.1.p1  ORF type:complete len:103 (+),score=4.22 EC725054.1:165-473(+)